MFGSLPSLTKQTLPPAGSPKSATQNISFCQQARSWEHQFLTSKITPTVFILISR